jgi:glucose 1-dehydrogenase
MSSVHEELPFPHFAPYCMSKGGVKMMTRDLANRVGAARNHHQFNRAGRHRDANQFQAASRPGKAKGFVGEHPFAQAGKPEDVAGIAAFLASSDADYITGTTVFADGGLLWNYSEQ